MIKVICDRCGKDITGSDVFGVIRIKTYSNPDFNSAFRWVYGEEEDKHFCKKCVNDVVDYILFPPFCKDEAAGDAENAADQPPEEEETAAEKQRESIGGAGPEADEEAPPEETKPRSPARKRLDVGKIMALKAAGWNNKKIADEMGTTEATIYSIFYRKKKKEENAGEQENI